MSGTRLCVVRHGETAWNAEGRVQGQLDVPLNQTGLAQASALARALSRDSFSAIYSSDLGRARQTAQPVADLLKQQIVLDRRLRERHYGVFQGMTYAEAKENIPEGYARFKARDPAYDFENGEPLAAFHGRALAFARLLHEGHKGESILVVTHGGVLEMIYRQATGRGLSTPRDFEIPNAAINRVEVDGTTWRVRTWADIGHLSVALDDLPD